MQEPTFLSLAEPSKLWGVSENNAEVIRASPRRMAVDLLRLFLANRTPLTLWGPVGARKTRSIEGLRVEVDENGTPFQVITVQPSTEDPTVIHGMMYTSRDTDGRTIMSRSIPDIAQQVVNYYNDHHGLTILFLDEMTTCMPAQQHALLGILTHGKYGNLDISPYISVVMAANPQNTVSTVNDLGEQVLNRGGHIPWYGDVNLFLEEWSNGFGRPENKPEKKVEWYIRELLSMAPQKAFRNERWDTDELVPWESLEHTERSVTETARMIELVNKTFENCDDQVRHLYIIETTRALLGQEWAENMALVTNMESDSISIDSIVAKIREHRITMTTEFDDLMSILGQSLYTLPSGATLRQDQANKLMEDLLEDSYRKDVFSADTYTAAWAFIVSAETSGQTASLHGFIFRLFTLGIKIAKKGLLTSPIPEFAGFLKEDIKGLIQASQAA